MDISQESDPKSQYEIPVRSSFGKNFECYVRERYLKNISVVGVYRAAIPSKKFSWEGLPPIWEVSNLLCYLVFTQIVIWRPWKVWIHTASLVYGFVASVQGKEIQKSSIMVKSDNSKIWIVTYNSSDPIRFLHDSPIFPIIRFLRFPGIPQKHFCF